MIVGIVLVRTVQLKDDIVVTFPQSNHFGVSLGWMVGESITFAINEWFPRIRKAMTALCSLCKPFPIPYEELLTMEAVSVGESSPLECKCFVLLSRRSFEKDAVHFKRGASGRHRRVQQLR